jgi:3-oxoacyl-[acyl-carrier-protein] synthase-3
MGSAILGLGHYLPEEVERLGVRRPIAIEPVGPSKLAARAAGPALSQAGLRPADIDFIVFATMTPDVTFPGAGCYLQDEMGCNTVGALDIRAQCAGFVFALAIADQFVRAGVYRRIVIAGAELHSSGLDYSEKGSEVARLYGDGAGVAVIGPASGSKGLRGIAMHTDGRRHLEFWVEYPASRQHPVRVTADDIRAGRHFPRIQAEAVRKFMLEATPAVMEEAIGKSGVARELVDRWIIGTIFPDAAHAIAERLGLKPDTVDVPAERHGHLTAGALPVALSEAVERGHVGPGSIVGLAACGAGFAWGAAIVEL